MSHGPDDQAHGVVTGGGRGRWEWGQGGSEKAEGMHASGRCTLLGDFYRFSPSFGCILVLRDVSDFMDSWKINR